MSTKHLLIGREMRSLTPQEIEELIALSGIDRKHVCRWREDGDIEFDDNDDPIKPANVIHDEIDARIMPCGDGPNEPDKLAIRYGFSCGGETEEWDEDELIIIPGEMFGGYGDHIKPVEVVYWFLANGWRWAQDPTKKEETK